MCSSDGDDKFYSGVRDIDTGEYIITAQIDVQIRGEYTAETYLSEGEWNEIDSSYSISILGIIDQECETVDLDGEQLIELEETIIEKII